MTNEAMTKGERRELSTLARKRAKLLKAAAAERRAVLMADFESQLASIYTPDDDAAMKQLYATAEAAVATAGAELAERCAELGIPKRFAPSINLYWYGRGENAIKDRRVELRQVARTRLEALERHAITEIEKSCVETETQLIAGGLTTDAARTFLASMPDPDHLMPKLDASEIQGLLSKGPV